MADEGVAKFRGEVYSQTSAPSLNCSKYKNVIKEYDKKGILDCYGKNDGNFNGCILNSQYGGDTMDSIFKDLFSNTKTSIDNNFLIFMDMMNSGTSLFQKGQNLLLKVGDQKVTFTGFEKELEQNINMKYSSAFGAVNISQTQRDNERD